MVDLPEAADALIAHGWRLRVADAFELAAHARHMRDVAAGDARALAYADLFDAWGGLLTGDRARCDASLAAATTLHFDTRVPDAASACAQLRAYLQFRDGRSDDAIHATDPILQAGDANLPPALEHATRALRALVHEQRNEFDEALREHHAAVAAARRTGDIALVASALGYLGGLQCSLLNLDDALPLCDEAWALCEHAPWPTVVATVGINRLMTLSGLGRHDEACAVVRRLIEYEPRLTDRVRAQRHYLYGCALARAGRHDAAQTCLDRGLAAHPAGTPTRVEWVWVQAHVFNHTGRPAEALSLVEPYLDPARRTGNDFPIDEAYLFSEAACACEQLGDLAAALAHERRAARARAAAAQQAAHARRVTLQINFDLDAARRQRDDALREQQRSLHEQRRLAELNAALHAANEAKTRFLAAASHDLRQPVHALGLQLATLRAVTRRGAAADIRERMENTVGALTSMFDLLLDMSRMDAGVTPVHACALDLRTLLVRVADEFADAAAAKNLRFVLRVPADACARTDPLLFERLLRNLLDNAVKYTAAGGVLLALRRRALADGELCWQLQVWDTGRGIAVDEQTRVFDEFYQAGDGAADRAAGLGLGLAIVKRLGALLDHRLALASRAGRGTRVTVELPWVASVDAVSETPARRSTASSALCVAVIEDDGEVRAAMRALLAQWGHRVVDGADSRDVLAACSGGIRPGAVIADYRLRGPRTGDAEAAALCHALQADLPTLIVTGDTAPERLRALASSGLPWLSKPVAPVRLRSWLATLGEPASTPA
jgi:signal transduction histidine kinase/CheY-like chemotaxis protein